MADFVDLGIENVLLMVFDWRGVSKVIKPGVGIIKSESGDGASRLIILDAERKKMDVVIVEGWFGEVSRMMTLLGVGGEGSFDWKKNELEMVWWWWWL